LAQEVGRKNKRYKGEIGSAWWRMANWKSMVTTALREDNQKKKEIKHDACT
jgi:hypothetical protein